MTPEKTDYGFVSNIRVAKDKKKEGLYYLALLATASGAVHLPMSEGVTRALWSQLGKILYPKEVEQMSATAPTAITFIGDDRRVAHLIKASVRKDEQRYIEVTGISREDAWTLHFSNKEAQQIWNHLDGVFSKK